MQLRHDPLTLAVGLVLAAACVSVWCWLFNTNALVPAWVYELEFRSLDAWLALQFVILLFIVFWLAAAAAALAVSVRCSEQLLVRSTGHRIIQDEPVSFRANVKQMRSLYAALRTQDLTVIAPTLPPREPKQTRFSGHFVYGWHCREDRIGYVGMYLSGKGLRLLEFSGESYGVYQAVFSREAPVTR